MLRIVRAVAVGLAVPGLLLWGITPSQATEPWTGSVSLSVDDTTTTANDRSAALTVSLTQQRPSGYAVSVFDDTGARTWCSTSITALTATLSVSPPLHKSRTYRAHVTSGSCPATPPSGGSNEVTVRNIGYDGTVSLTAASATTNANDKSTTLHVSVSQPRPSGYAVVIFDNTDARAWCSTYVTATEWDISVSPPLHDSRTYRAFMVPGGCPATTPTGSGFDAASSPVTVRNVGYDGTVTVTADSVWVDAEDPSAQVTVSISKPRPSGYAVSLFDDTGARRWCSTSFTGTTFALAVTPAVDDATTYTAYVHDGGCPGTAPIDADREGSVTVHSGVDNPADLDFVTVAPALAATATTSQACLELSLSPTATHQLGSSLSDQQIACEAGLASNGSLKTGLQTAINTAGATGSTWWLLHNRTTTSPRTIPASPPPDPTDEEGETRTGPKDPKPPQLPSHWRSNDLADTLIEHNPEAGLTPSDAHDIAEQCLWQAARAGLNAFRDCKTLPIFATGNDVAQATIHDAEAMDSSLAEFVRPGGGWVKLNRDISGKPKTWKTTRCNKLPEPPSDTLPSGTFDCDEYPYLSTTQGGRGASPAPHLKRIDSGQNQLQGSRLNSFYENCGLEPGSEKAFLVVPLVRVTQVTDSEGQITDAYEPLPIPTQVSLCNESTGG